MRRRSVAPTKTQLHSRVLVERRSGYPEAASAAVSAAMRGNGKVNTRPELAVRHWLREAGIVGYRLHWSLLGKPDLAFPGRRIAVFVHGCFWHSCERCAIARPRHNSEYWSLKLERNRRRDEATRAHLAAEGWNVYVIWECEVWARGAQSVAPLVKALLTTNNRWRQPRLAPWRSRPGVSPR